MNSNNLVVTILVIVALAGCASTPPPKDGVLSTNKQMAAVVYGQGGGLGGHLTALLVPIGTHKDIELVGIDGGGAQTAPDGKGREYWIVPGKHTLDIRCSLQLANRDIYGKSTVEITLEQGKEYLLDARGKAEQDKWGSIERSCEPFIVVK